MPLRDLYSVTIVLEPEIQSSGISITRHAEHTPFLGSSTRESVLKRLGEVSGKD